ncbi:MAG: peptidase S8, partial [Tepidisphaeraceae bacterium]
MQKGRRFDAGPRVDVLESRLLRSAVVNDPSYSAQADLTAINVTAAWKKSTGNLNVVVADIDTGIDYTHPDLYANIWINQAEIPAAIKVKLKDVDGDGRIS